MSRLTVTTRERIAEAAVAFTFDPKKKVLDEIEAALAHEAHATVFSKAELDKAGKAPAGWIRRDTRLRFNVGGMTIDLNTSQAGLPVPYNSPMRVGSIEPGELCDRIQGHAKERDGLRIARKDAATKLTAMLASVTTVKKLREVWPEGEQFYAKYEAAPAPSVPAIRVEEINAILGLAA